MRAVRAVRVRVPATTANLGPGFDCLGLALDLWNEAEFCLEGSGLSIEMRGEGAERLPRNADNLIARTFASVYARLGLDFPTGLRISVNSGVPTSSGLGSSAAAALLGFLGADALSGSRLGPDEILQMASDLEGHADNVSAAALGGLTVSLYTGSSWLVRRYDVPVLRASLVLPDIDLPTSVARQALPKAVPRGDAVFNLGRTAMVAEAMRAGDLDLLAQVMDDRLHQPYRLPLIRGAAEAMEAAKQLGAKAVAISGAGPSLIAFCAGESRPVGQAMAAAFASLGVASRVFDLQTTSHGASVEEL